MLNDEKILLTGPAGQIAFPMASYLAQSNEVWGIARFSEPGSRERVEATGVTTRIVDLASGDFGELPDDFTLLVHMAAFQGPGLDFDYAMRVNAEAAGLLMGHCHKARAALVASTCSVYSPHEDPWHPYTETDPIAGCVTVHCPTYSTSKIAEEAVVRSAARQFGLPTTVARINASYGPNGGLPAYMLDWIMAGDPVSLRAPAPSPYSPIHQDDMNEQVESLLAAASVPATIVNWAGDEIVTAEEFVGYLGGLGGRSPELVYAEYPGSQIGTAADVTLRRRLTGACRVSWQEGMREMFDARYPGGERAAQDQGAARLGSHYQEGGD